MKSYSIEPLVSKGSDSNATELMPSHPKNNWSKLPTDIKRKIFQHLNYEDAYRFVLTSKANFIFFQENSETFLFKKIFKMTYDGHYPKLLLLLKNFITHPKKYTPRPLEETIKVKKAIDTYIKNHQSKPFDTLLKSTDFHLLSFLGMIFLHPNEAALIPHVIEGPIFKERWHSDYQVKEFFDRIPNYETKFEVAKSFYLGLFAKSLILKNLESIEVLFKTQNFYLIDGISLFYGYLHGTDLIPPPSSYISIKIPLEVPPKLLEFRKLIAKYDCGPFSFENSEKPSNWDKFLEALQIRNIDDNNCNKEVILLKS